MISAVARAARNAAELLDVVPAPGEARLADAVGTRAEAGLLAVVAIPGVAPANGTRSELQAPDGERFLVWGHFPDAANSLRPVDFPATCCPADKNLAGEERCGFRWLPQVQLPVGHSRAEKTHWRRSADEALHCLDAERYRCSKRDGFPEPCKVLRRE